MIRRPGNGRYQAASFCASSGSDASTGRLISGRRAARRGFAGAVGSTAATRPPDHREKAVVRYRTTTIASICCSPANASPFVWVVICLAAIATTLVSAEEAPVAAPRPDVSRRLTLSELDQLLRAADIAVDVHQSWDLRIKAIVRLGETRSRYARPALLAVLHRADSDQGLRGTAAFALANIDDVSVVDDLVDLLTDNNDQVASVAAKGLQSITRREGHAERLPAGANSPARVEIQDNWRLWWKMNRHRFERRMHRELAELRTDSKRLRRAPVPSPVVAAFRVERLDIDNKWVKIPDDEPSWSHDRLRWIVLFANVPGAKRVRWLHKPWDDLHDKSVPWKEFAAAAADQPAEGKAGIGDWAITAEIEFDDGRKLLVDGGPGW
ncbi:MAG: HEAT repeat domain-containing protein [Planctomycetes bacterium]|nr:HEAT repeat domain-containing protein [Planctomycetota bacterium]